MRTVIINADDLGYDPEVDRGILEAARDGIVTSATLMVNLPFAKAAVEAAKAVPSLGLGLHVNLARGDAFATSTSLRGPDGRLDEARAPTATAADAEREARAQLRRFHQLVGRAPTHLDVHKHLHRHPGIFEGLKAAAKKHGLPLRAIDEGMRAALKAEGIPTTDFFVGDTGEAVYWSAEKVLSALDAAGEGVTELMCHPGYRPKTTRSGYSAQREDELRAFTEARVVARAKKGDLRLATWAAVGPTR